MVLHTVQVSHAVQSQHNLMWPDDDELLVDDNSGLMATWMVCTMLLMCAVGCALTRVRYQWHQNALSVPVAVQEPLLCGLLTASASTLRSLM